MKRLFAIAAIATFLATASAAPVFQDNAEHAYPQPLIVEQV